MPNGQLGGQKFSGYIADFQMFGSSLPEESIYEWTSCQDQVINKNFMEKLTIFNPKKSGDLYSLTDAFDRISLQLQNIDYSLGVSAQKWTKSLFTSLFALFLNIVQPC